MNSPAQSSVSFIVLALNEEAHIEAAVNEVLAGVKMSGVGDYEIILVDDCSTDGTGEIMDRLAFGNGRFKVLHNPVNLGVGNAYKQGIRLATCDYVMTIAGDNIMPPSDMATILGHLGKADMILPYLTNPKLRTLGRRIGSKGFTVLLNLIFGLNISYYQGVLPRRDILEKITINNHSHAFAAEIAVKLLKAGHSYVEVGIGNTPTKMGNSVALQPRRLCAVCSSLLTLIAEVYRPNAGSSVPEH